ncbi:MAG: ribose transport system permease protein [Rhodospirillaceae bacterium]|nr:ribose transport system permease protein [Rhodospirillaceae bacterium]
MIAEGGRSSASGFGTGRFTAALGLWLPVAVVIGLVAFFSIASDSFLTLRNLTAICGQASALLLCCLGATFVILMGSIDLSVGAMVLLVASITAMAINAFGLGIEATAVAIVIGTLLGLANGLVFAYGAIPSFVVTLGSLSVFSGLAWNLLSGRSVSFDSPAFENLAIGQLIPYVPNITLFALAAWCASIFVCYQTRFGRYMYVIGGGEAVAKTSGVPVRRYKIYAFVLSGAMAGLGGALALARLGSAGPTLGSELLLNSLAAIVVGGTSLSGGVGGVQRTLIGVLIITVLDDGLNLIGTNQFSQTIIKGVVVIAAVLVSQDRSKIVVMK